MVLYDLEGAFLLSLVMILTPLPLYFLEKRLAPKISLSLSAPKSVRRGKSWRRPSRSKDLFYFFCLLPMLL